MFEFEGECPIETGYFFFNTEAHPIDGASLECCRILRNKELKNEDEDMNIFNHLNLEKLFDRYVDLSTGSNRLDEFEFEKNDKENERDD